MGVSLWDRWGGGGVWPCSVPIFSGQFCCVSLFCSAVLLSPELLQFASNSSSQAPSCNSKTPLLGHPLTLFLWASLLFAATTWYSVSRSTSLQTLCQKKTPFFYIMWPSKRRYLSRRAWALSDKCFQFYHSVYGVEDGLSPSKGIWLVSSTILYFLLPPLFSWGACVSSEAG